MKKAQPKSTVRVSVKQLIQANRAAIAREKKADAATQTITYPDGVRINIPECGPRCAAWDVESLTKLAEGHRDNLGLKGLELMAFNKRMSAYHNALQMLLGLHKEWRQSSNIDAIETEYSEASDELDATFKALIQRCKTARGDIPEIAAHFASDGVQTSAKWRVKELLKVIGKGAESRA